jgi:hypothetical protein
LGSGMALSNSLVCLIPVIAALFIVSMFFPYAM